MPLQRLIRQTHIILASTAKYTGTNFLRLMSQGKWLKIRIIFLNGLLIIQQNLHLAGKMEENLVSVTEAKRFVRDCFLASKVRAENAQAMADLLIEADYRGHFSHGMNRLGKFNKIVSYY